MKSTIMPGVVLGLIVVAWMYVIGFTGWYKDPAMVSLFYLVIVFQLVVLVWGLRITAAEGKSYGAQIGSGMIISLIGSVIIFIGSYLFTTVVFPQYFEELRAMTEVTLRAEGKTEAEIQTILNLSASMWTPIANALTGVVGTLITGLVGSLIISIFVRKK